ncbi:MAG: hypothetical protein AAF226_15950, partial [Verrucomicrobiota bacterium]
IDERDSVELNRVSTQDGWIDIDAAGDITVTHVESLTDKDSNDVTLHSTGGDILIDRLDAGLRFGDVFLNADSGGIDEVSPSDGGVDLIADNLEVKAAHSFGGSSAIETELNTATVEVFGKGGIGFNEQSSIVLNSLTTLEGRIDVTAGSNVKAHQISSFVDSAGSSMSFEAGGSFHFDSIIAGLSSQAPSVPAAGASVSIKAGRIQEYGDDAAIDLRGKSLELTSTSGGIGTLNNGIEITGSQLSSVSRAGANVLQNFADVPVRIDHLEAQQGTVLFEQFGGSTVIDSLKNGFGDVDVFQYGGGNLFIGNATLGNGDLMANVQNAGRLGFESGSINGDVFLKADEMDFPGSPKSISGTGALRILHDDPRNATYVNPYHGESDMLYQLEVDSFSLARLDFDQIFFLGNVLFAMPHMEKSGINSDTDSSGGKLESWEIDLLGGASTYTFSDQGPDWQSQISVSSIDSELSLYDYVDHLGYSPQGVTGLEPSSSNQFGLATNDPRFEKIFENY